MLFEDLKAYGKKAKNKSQPFSQQVVLHLHQMPQDPACVTLQFLAVDDECKVETSSLSDPR